MKHGPDSIKWKQKRRSCHQKCHQIHLGGAPTEVPRVRLPKGRSGVRNNTTNGYLFGSHKSSKRTNNHLFGRTGGLLSQFWKQF